MSALLEVNGLGKAFRVGGRRRGSSRLVRAVDDVSFDVARAETFALVGESGSGKSTTARLVLRLLPADAGSVRLDGAEVLTMGRRELVGFRRSVQVVFQDPYSSLDPTWPVLDIVAEPLRTHRGLRARPELRREVRALLDQVGLPARTVDRVPNELSGGQRQRVAIARALALQPKLIVCDEPVSALDVSTQAQVVTLLADLQDEHGLAYLFIAHDLALTRQISRRIAVMLLGRVVEVGPADTVYHRAAHPYTQALISAVPIADPRRQRARRRIVLRGDVVTNEHRSTGCPFHTRCPEAMDVCRAVEPPLVTVSTGHRVACHLHADTPVPVPKLTRVLTGGS